MTAGQQCGSKPGAALIDIDGRSGRPQEVKTVGIQSSFVRSKVADGARHRKVLDAADALLAQLDELLGESLDPSALDREAPEPLAETSGQPSHDGEGPV